MICDGRLNKGRLGGSYVVSYNGLIEPVKTVVREDFGEGKSSQEAEWLILIAALKRAKEVITGKHDGLCVMCDNDVVLQQIAKNSKARGKYKNYVHEVTELIKEFKYVNFIKPPRAVFKFALGH